MYILQIIFMKQKSFKLNNKNFLFYIFQKSSFILYKSWFSPISLNIIIYQDINLFIHLLNSSYERFVLVTLRSEKKSINIFIVRSWLQMNGCKNNRFLVNLLVKAVTNGLIPSSWVFLEVQRREHHPCSRCYSQPLRRYSRSPRPPCRFQPPW